MDQRRKISALGFHQYSAPSTRRTRCSRKRKKKKKGRFALPYSSPLLSNDQRGWSRPLTVIHVVKLIIKSGNGAPYRYDTKVDTRFTRRFRGEEPVVLPRPIHSDAVGHSVESGIPGVTHTAPSPRRGDEASSIYKCGSTWLRGRLVSSLLRVRAETVVSPPPPPPFSAPSDARESDRLIEISRWIGNWTDARNRPIECGVICLLGISFREGDYYELLSWIFFSSFRRGRKEGTVGIESWIREVMSRNGNERRDSFLRRYTKYH